MGVLLEEGCGDGGRVGSGGTQAVKKSDSNAPVSPRFRMVGWELLGTPNIRWEGPVRNILHSERWPQNPCPSGEIPRMKKVASAMAVD